MITFLSAVFLLLTGFFLYSRIIERVFQTDSKRLTPAYALKDGVDYVPMKTSKVYLIQLLNIAGLGPILVPKTIHRPIWDRKCICGLFSVPYWAVVFMIIFRV